MMVLTSIDKRNLSIDVKAHGIMIPNEILILYSKLSNTSFDKLYF